jgi:hypothetical protein
VRSDVARDLTKSHRAFVDLVWPEIVPCLRGGSFMAVEGTATDELRRSLDELAGIDAWHIANGCGMRGIASRVQFGPEAWDTFTIRYQRDSGNETEWAKRLSALDDRSGGWLLPALTIHAYCTDDGATLIGAALVRTADLFTYARSHLAADDRRVWLKENRAALVGDANTFVVVPWLHLQQDGVKVAVRPREHKCRALRAPSKAAA